MLHEPSAYCTLQSFPVIPEAWPQKIVVHSQFIRFLVSETGKNIFYTLIGQDHVRDIADQGSAKQWFRTRVGHPSGVKQPICKAGHRVRPQPQQRVVDVVGNNWLLRRWPESDCGILGLNGFEDL